MQFQQPDSDRHAGSHGNVLREFFSLAEPYRYSRRLSHGVNWRLQYLQQLRGQEWQAARILSIFRSRLTIKLARASISLSGCSALPSIAITKCRGLAPRSLRSSSALDHPIISAFAAKLSRSGHTYAFTPNLINEFRASFSRQFLSTLSHPYPNSVTSQSQVEQELAPIQLPSNSYFPTPNFEIDNVSGGGNGIDFGPEPWVNIATGSEAYTIIDNVTKIIGKHTMKMGYIYRLDHASYESDDPTTLDFNASLAQDPNSFLGGNWSGAVYDGSRSR